MRQVAQSQSHAGLGWIKKNRKYCHSAAAGKGPDVVLHVFSIEDENVLVHVTV